MAIEGRSVAGVLSEKVGAAEIIETVTSAGRSELCGDSQ